MKYTWESQDIAAGRLIETHNRSERSIIGYDPSIPSDSNLAVISLIDGSIIIQRQSRDSLVTWLNESKARPVQIAEGDHLKPSR